jgi:hypothetical protein
VHQGKLAKEVDKYDACEIESSPSALSYFTSIPNEYFHSPKFLKPYPHPFKVATKCSIICGALCDILLPSTHSAIIKIALPLPTSRENLDATP